MAGYSIARCFRELRSHPGPTTPVFAVSRQGVGDIPDRESFARDSRADHLSQPECRADEFCPDRTVPAESHCRPTLPRSFLNAGLSMEASGRQRKRPIRRSSRKKASGKALCPSSGVPTTAAGSGTPPMCSHRLARPYPANLVRGIITGGENKTEFCGICFRKLVLTPAAKSTCRNMCDFKLTQCLWAHLS